MYDFSSGDYVLWCGQVCRVKSRCEFWFSRNHNQAKNACYVSYMLECGEKEYKIDFPLKINQTLERCEF